MRVRRQIHEPASGHLLRLRRRIPVNHRLAASEEQWGNMAVPSRSIVVLALLSIVVLSTIAIADAALAPRKRHHPHIGPQNVTYDGRSLFINGKRELLFSGSIHYARSTPEVPKPPLK